MRLFTLVLVLITHNLSAQLTDAEYLIDYKDAVQLYAKSDFEASIQKLNPLTSRAYENAIVPYALYYVALSTFHSDIAHQTRSTLRDLMQRYPNWEKINEAYYLYATANFKDSYYEEGLSYIERITDPTLSKDVADLLSSYIIPINNIVILKGLYSKFPNQKIIAEALVNNIQSRPFSSKEDLELSDLLTNRFELENEVEIIETQTGLIRDFDDQIIDFGILLPFELEQFDIDKATTDNKYVYDLFLGMQLAESKLQNEGIPVRLYSFDVGRAAESIAKYLEDDNFKKVDILIGPLYGRPNRLVEDYTEENKIYQVHPISNSRTLISDSPSRFLAQPSYEMQALKALEFAANLDIEKSVSIYYGAARKDSVMAFIYANEAKRQGFIVNENKRYWDEESVALEQEVGHVFITGNTDFGPEVLKGIGQSEIDSIIIGTATSFDFEKDTQHMQSRNLFLIDPSFVDPERTHLKEFKRAFIDKVNMNPSYYAYLGYDLMLFYGQMLKDGKDIFRLNLDENPIINELLLSGFDYSERSNENKIVPIVKFNHGQFEMVNSNNE